MSVFLGPTGLRQLKPRYSTLPVSEFFDGKAIQVYDISAKVANPPAANSVGLKTIAADDIFEPGTIFLGMSLPSIYMACVVGPMELKVFAPKSLREPSYAVDSGGRVQSGLFFVATNITAEEVGMARGGGATLRANVVLARFGVTCTLTDFALPHQFLSAFLLECPDAVVKVDGRPMNFAIVKTTPENMDKYFRDIRFATMSTLYRHLRKSLSSKDALQRRDDLGCQLCVQSDSRSAALSSGFSSSRASGNPEAEHDSALLSSAQTCLGVSVGIFWKAHELYKLHVGENPHYLGRLKQLLPPVQESHTCVVTADKSSILSIAGAVSEVRSQLASYFNRWEGFTEQNLLQLMPLVNRAREKKCKIVITDQEMIVIVTMEPNTFVQRIFSRHLLVHSFSSDVRFSGELSKDIGGTIHVNPDSQTCFLTFSDRLDRAVELLTEVFPHLTFVTNHPATPQPTSATECVALAGDELWELVVPSTIPSIPFSSTRKIGVLLLDFDPLTTHHEAIIESALGSGVLDKLVLVASDTLPGLLHTPLLARQNILHEQFRSDPRVVTFFAHSMKITTWGWEASIVAKLRCNGYFTVSVFLWEDYQDPTKQERLLTSVPGDAYLILHGSEVEPSEIPEADPKTAKPVLKHPFSPPPRAADVRGFLQSHPELYSDRRLLQCGEAELALSPVVRKYIYDTKLYYRWPTTGNMTDGLRNIVGTGLATLLGRDWPLSEEARHRAVVKLGELGC